MAAKALDRIPCKVDDHDRHRIREKLKEGQMEDILEDIRLSEDGNLLVLDKRFKSDRAQRKRNGQSGMSRAARHRVRGSLVALASVAPQGTLSFFTATCPEIDWETDRLVASNWATVVTTFLKRLRRLLATKGLPMEYVYVTEIQVKRWKRTGRPYLHLHLVFRGRKSANSPWAVTRSELRSHWLGALNSVTPSDPYYLAVCDLRACDEGIAKYLSKYLSKGSDISREVVEAGLQDWFPRQWWGSSRSVVQERKSLTFKSRGANARQLFLIMKTGGHGHTDFLYPVEMIGADGNPYTVGYCFALKPSAYDTLMAGAPLPVLPGVPLTRPEIYVTFA